MQGWRRGRDEERQIRRAHVGRWVEIAEGGTGRGMMGGAMVGLRLLHLFERRRAELEQMLEAL